MIAGFSATERDYICRNLDQFFSTLPTVADGFLLKTWRSNPQAGQPKVPLPAKGLIERGLMRIDTTQQWPRLLLTETGLVALRTIMTNRRLADPERYAHIRQELGIPSGARASSRGSRSASVAIGLRATLAHTEAERLRNSNNGYGPCLFPMAGGWPAGRAVRESL
ncbi:MAG TPA: hypothetical protein VGM32_05320 [Rhodopila sp.]|jgi:hypothetical protein